MKKIIKKEDIEKIYAKPPSLAKYLPWQDYSDKAKLFLLEDNQSLAAGFEFVPISCEARPEKMMEEISKSLSEALKNAIPCEKNNPWILQLFIGRSRDLTSHYQQIENYIHPNQKNSAFTKAHLKTLKKHLEYTSQKEGIFFDRQVTNQIFKGGFLHVTGFIYRRIKDGKERRENKKSKNNDKTLRRNSVEEIVRISRKLTDQLRACGIKVKRLEGKVFYRWMVKWFNPNFNLYSLNFPTEKEKPFGWNLTENIFFKAPVSKDELWWFDELPHKVMTIQSLNVNPPIGHLTAERKRNIDDKIFNLVDHLPEESILSLNLVFQAPSEVELHLKTIHDSAVGRHALAIDFFRN